MLEVDKPQKMVSIYDCLSPLVQERNVKAATISSTLSSHESWLVLGSEWEGSERDRNWNPQEGATQLIRRKRLGADHFLRFVLARGQEKQLL